MNNSHQQNLLKDRVNRMNIDPQLKQELLQKLEEDNNEYHHRLDEFVSDYEQQVVSSFRHLVNSLHQQETPLKSLADESVFSLNKDQQRTVLDEQLHRLFNAFQDPILLSQVLAEMNYIEVFRLGDFLSDHTSHLPEDNDKIQQLVHHIFLLKAYQSLEIEQEINKLVDQEIKSLDQSTQELDQILTAAEEELTQYA